uniref:Retinoblastoma-like 2 (p130) n=1 Tax=Knipowitschia caucasica TaxID=637954 RepID=A0AAV2KYP6_KNICA
MTEDEEKAHAGFEDLCRAVNMDQDASCEAWKNYLQISSTFTLEGDARHWLVCALYVACRSSVPTLDKGTCDGNYVSLTRILRSAPMSLIEFFNKLKKWQDMAQLPAAFRQRTERLERNFTVSAVIFRKYVPIFKSVFKSPTEEPARLHRSRKQRRHPCSVPELFHFCWVLFVHAKGNFPMISDDLVNSYHLLLCAVDLVFCGALLCPSRKELLNPNFAGLPEDFSSKDFRTPSPPLCFLQPLCELHDGLVLEAKGVKEHFWKPFIKKLFHKRVLRGKEDALSGFLDPMNFGDSLSGLNRVYEEHVLASGGLDERIFTGDAARDDIGTPGPCLCEGEENQDSAIYRLHSRLTALALKVSTPLTGRRFVPENSLSSPVSRALESVGRLHTLLSGSRHGPSVRLTSTLKACARDPTESISLRLKEMCDTFSHYYESSAEESGGMDRDMALKYFSLAEMLYYRTLESIIDREKGILGDADLSGLFEKDLFQRSLVACCVEMVLFSYRPPGNFPQVIRLFSLPAFHFYKVIEVLVRAEQSLFREVVKHLNQIEEQVLDSLAWTRDSPLWDSLGKDHVPSCREVMPPQFLEQSDGSSSVTLPLTVNQGPDQNANKVVSPSPTTLTERYSSPPATFKRRLFVDPPESGTKASPRSLAPVPSGQTVVATATLSANNGQTLTIPVQGIANQSGGITFILPAPVNMTPQTITAQTLTGTFTVQSAVARTSPRAKPASAIKKGSLCLFFRKVYHLASVRLRDLCQQLDIGSELRTKIWSCFEFSLLHCTQLLMGRHLDQLLMCAIYVVAKVMKEDRSFQNIMRCYRLQPQSHSDVYRNVLISETTRPTTPSRPTTTSKTTRPTNDKPDSPKSSIQTAAETGEAGSPMRQFALRFASATGSPPAVPFPSLRSGSPRRMLLSTKHSIYISPHSSAAPSTDKLCYYICSSPPHRLQEINSMIRCGESRKRPLSAEEEPASKRRGQRPQSPLRGAIEQELSETRRRLFRSVMKI